MSEDQIKAAIDAQPLFNISDLTCLRPTLLWLAEELTECFAKPNESNIIDGLLDIAGIIQCFLYSQDRRVMAEAVAMWSEHHEARGRRQRQAHYFMENAMLDSIKSSTPEEQLRATQILLDRELRDEKKVLICDFEKHFRNYLEGERSGSKT